MVLTKLLWCDILLLVRALEAEGIDLSPIQPHLRADWNHAQHELARIFMTGIERRLPGAVRARTYSEKGLSYILDMPGAHCLLESLNGRRMLRQQASDILYGYRNDFGNVVGVDAVGIGNSLYMFFFHVDIDVRWYQKGLRLAAAWRHMLSLPDKVRVLVQSVTAGSPR